MLPSVVFLPSGLKDLLEAQGQSLWGGRGSECVFTVSVRSQGLVISRAGVVALIDSW